MRVIAVASDSSRSQAFVAIGIHVFGAVLLITGALLDPRWFSLVQLDLTAVMISSVVRIARLLPYLSR